MKFILIVLTSMALSFSASARSRQWTILVYWAVDNDLYEFSKPYLNQFEKLAPSSEVSIVVEYDYPDHRPSRRFHIQHSDHYDPLQELSTSILLEELGETDSANPTVLKNFIEMGQKRFPSEHTLLVIGSHGSNWSGLIEDMTSRRYMSLANFGSALTDKKIDLVLFDTCRMAFLESLMTLENKAQYFLASPFDVNGFDHIHPLGRLIDNPALPLKNLGEMYVKHYPLKPENVGQKEMAAALLDPAMATELVNDFENLSSLLNQKDLSEFKEKLSMSVNEEQDWDIDLFDLVKKAGESFPDLMMSAEFFSIKYHPIVLAEAQTSVTLPHSGLSVACAEKQIRYRATAAGKRLVNWRKLCHQLRQ